jgi:hypothetical protein
MGFEEAMAPGTGSGAARVRSTQRAWRGRRGDRGEAMYFGMALRVCFVFGAA